jgi:hypothetical protein
LVYRWPGISLHFPSARRWAARDGAEQAGTPGDGGGCRQRVPAAYGRLSGVGFRNSAECAEQQGQGRAIIRRWPCPSSTSRHADSSACCLEACEASTPRTSRSPCSATNSPCCAANKRPEFRPADRALLAMLSGALPRWRWSSFLVTPDTILRWHRRCADPAAGPREPVVPTAAHTGCVSISASHDGPGTTRPKSSITMGQRWPLRNIIRSTSRFLARPAAYP